MIKYFELWLPKPEPRRDREGVTTSTTGTTVGLQKRINVMSDVTTVTAVTTENRGSCGNPETIVIDTAHMNTAPSFAVDAVTAVTDGNIVGSPGTYQVTSGGGTTVTPVSDDASDDTDDLRISVHRLEHSAVNIAVWDDGGMRVLNSVAEARNARSDGGTVYTVEDMFFFVHLEPRERRLLHSFKKKYGGTTQWRQENISGNEK